jgi:aminoglycoside phosphotransferase (APT) family kinase protein
MEEPDSFETVLAALRAAGRIAGPSTVRRLSGGVSSFIAVVGEAGGDPWVLKAARHRLDVRDDWTADPRRAHREGAILNALDGSLGPLRVPRVYRIHDDPPVLELEWLAPPAVNWKAELLAGRVDLGIVDALARGMAVLHRRPVPAGIAGPAGAGLFDSLRLDPYYRHVAARHREHAAALERLIADCTASRPARLVHGDFTPKNVLATDGLPVLLDWEVIHAGDPAFDLGMLSAHLLLKACRDRQVPGASALWRAAAALAQAYDGPADPGLAVRHTGAIMLARLWGKSPVEYLTGEPERAAAAGIGARALHDGYGSLTALLDDLARLGERNREAL